MVWVVCVWRGGFEFSSNCIVLDSPKLFFCLKYLSWVCIPDVYSHFKIRHLKTDWNLCVSRGVNCQPQALISSIFRSFKTSDFSPLRNPSILRLRVWLLTFWNLSRERELEKIQYSVYTFLRSLVWYIVHSPSLFTVFPRAVVGFIFFRK